MSTAESKVFLIGGLRKIIFSYLRKKPTLRCHTCHRVLLWDPGEPKCKFIRQYDGYICLPCVGDNMHMYSCNIS